MSRWGWMAAVAAVAAMGAAGSAGAQTPPEGIVWIAVRDINTRYDDAEDPTNRPPLAWTAPAGMIRAVDVSHDGKPDWLIDYTFAEDAAFCGTGGCLRRLYVSDGDSYVRALDNQVLELTFPSGAVSAWVHSLYCADDNPDCRYVLIWDGAARALVERSTTSARPMGDEAWRPLRPETD